MKVSKILLSLALLTGTVVSAFSQATNTFASSALSFVIRDEHDVVVGTVKATIGIYHGPSWRQVDPTPLSEIGEDYKAPFPVPTLFDSRNIAPEWEIRASELIGMISGSDEPADKLLNDPDVKSAIQWLRNQKDLHGDENMDPAVRDLLNAVHNPGRDNKELCSVVERLRGYTPDGSDNGWMILKLDINASGINILKDGRPDMHFRVKRGPAYVNQLWDPTSGPVAVFNLKNQRPGLQPIMIQGTYKAGKNRVKAFIWTISSGPAGQTTAGALSIPFVNAAGLSLTPDGVRDWQVAVQQDMRDHSGLPRYAGLPSAPSTPPNPPASAGGTGTGSETGSTGFGKQPFKIDVTNDPTVVCLTATGLVHMEIVYADGNNPAPKDLVAGAKVSWRIAPDLTVKLSWQLPNGTVQRMTWSPSKG